MTFLFLVAGCLGSEWLFAADQPIPKSHPVDRYESLWKRSPFTLSSVSDPVVVAAGFARQLALAGVAKIGSVELVTLVNKQSQERLLISSQPNAQGIRLVSLQSDPDPSKITATIEKGVETAVVRFDAALLKSALSAQAPAMNAAAAQSPLEEELIQTQSPSVTQEQPPSATDVIRRRINIPANPPSTNP